MGILFKERNPQLYDNIIFRSKNLKILKVAFDPALNGDIPYIVGKL